MCDGVDAPREIEQGRGAEIIHPSADSHFLSQPAEAKVVSLRVLVVDENPEEADRLARLLVLWGHEPLIAFDGPSALALARRHQPRVAVFHWDLPHRGGYELARELPNCAEGVFLIALVDDSTEIAESVREGRCLFHLRLRKGGGLSEMRFLLEHLSREAPLCASVG
jgi:PleD family two-component response regulator